MEDTKLDEAMEEIAEQSFNDSELKDIMSEIESLEKEFVEEGERTPEELAVVSSEKTNLQNEIDNEVASMASEMATEATSPEASLEEFEDSEDDMMADELINEMEDDVVAEIADNVVTLPTSERKVSTADGAAMDFSAEGTMNFNLNFKIGTEAATLKVDGEQGLCVEMGGVLIEITSEHGCTVTMDGGVNFNIPLTTSGNAAKKKAA
ncbi:hypothetical protein [Halobacteriovorax sp. JY17]|uniref:hypothetical protein n=1 Tax=Halobacteriovorax sp. JY17 TaxID=2014617 RepID=UPI000C36E93B|nr:hypothetical protein [Halobacteriovorax sp. JY17]PIK16578.1 MAG: hypothetical protein CES88_07495 [Halobacteriovorax sp. JY17]